MRIALLGLMATLAFPLSVQANTQPFSAWVEGVKQEAIKKGISSRTVDAALRNVVHIDRVIELDRKQPEGTKTFAQYMQSVVPASRIQQARKLYHQNRPLLEKIGKEYGVQPRFIVALWGVESNFGQNMGGFSIVNALATLAYDGRRSEFFRGELMHALRILDEGHITPEKMVGSWAGAMGQTQFMPSSFLKLAVDYDGDGKRDIWTTRADAFASIANYLSKSGWDDEYTWGRKVHIPANMSPDLVSLDNTKTLAEWESLGIRDAAGHALPNAPIRASLIRPGKTEHFYYLIYPNYKVLLKWNYSSYFATAVSTLADSIY